MSLKRETQRVGSFKFIYGGFSGGGKKGKLLGVEKYGFLFLL